MSYGNIKNIFLSKRFLFTAFALFLLTSFVIFTTRGYFDLKKETKTRSIDSFEIIDQRMSFLLSNMNNFPRSASNDVLFLSNLSCLEEYMNSKKGSFVSNFSMSLIERNFLRFLEENIAYDQIRYIDENGYERVRVNYEGGKRWIVEDNDLQNKADRYYFKNTMMLNRGEVYISPLDLNIENNVVENLGTADDPKYVPMMRYSAPIFDKKGIRKGIVISNVNADYFLEDVHRFQNEGEITFLVNKDGYYLAHPDKKKEFGFMFGNDSNLHNDYYDIADKILQSPEKGRIETKDKIFSFWKISPSIGSFGLSQGAIKTLDGDYYWILVNIADKKGMGLDKDTSYIYYILFLSVIIFVTYYLAYLMTFKAER